MNLANGLEDFDAPGTRPALLRAARDLFHREGYSNVKINDVARMAGLTTGAVYYYFSGKEELLDIVATHYIASVSRLAATIYGEQGTTFSEKLQKLIIAHCVGVVENQPHVSLFYREHKNMTDSALAAAVDMNTRFLRFTTLIIEEGIAAGEFRKGVDAKLVALGIIGMCNWIYQWFSPSGPAKAEEIGRVYAELAIIGLTSDGPK